jgi:glycosyltransferase involved in cell wall biosynthesis
LIPRKSVETLLFAHEKLQRRGRLIACAIVGPGPEKDSLLRIIGERSLQHIFFAESHAPSTVPGWLLAAHALVLPSLSEGLPTVIMEAMALGLPVVATDISGTRELIRERETGLLFQPRDSAMLAGCLEQLMDNLQMRQEMSLRAQDFIKAKGFTTPCVAQKHLALYKTVCPSKE